MADPRLFRLRCTYVETGRLAMLSHLEVARALERTVRRAGLPFAVTQGFSPHMKIAFGAALPVGVGSTCEIFDVTLVDYVSPAKALAALQTSSVSDLMVTECCYVEPRAAAASVAFPFSTYEVRFAQDIGQASFVVPETVTVVRKRKEKTLKVADFLVGALVVEGNTARITLEAKDTGSLRIDVFLDALLKGSGAQVRSVTRVAQAASMS